MTFTYPTNRELRAIGPAKVARLTQERVGFQIMPMRSVNAGQVQWDQMDNFFGLQQLRGLDGAPTHVKRVGQKRYVYEPGVYGEFQTITETELTQRAGSVTNLDAAVDVSDLVLQMQDQLSGRELDRMEQIIWTLLTTGTFSVLLPSGEVGFTATFALSTYDATDWGTEATATPLTDFRLMRIANVGVGANFGSGATAYMNSVTAGNMLNNSNSADLGGKKGDGVNAIESLADVNRYQVANDLPRIVEYDEGYYNDSNVFTKYIPDDTVVVVGRRPAGQRIGEYILTRNVNNPGYAPGSYEFVKDTTGRADEDNRVVPPTVTYHRGHNGGPAIYYPGSIVIMDVGA